MLTWTPTILTLHESFDAIWYEVQGRIEEASHYNRQVKKTLYKLPSREQRLSCTCYTLASPPGEGNKVRHYKDGTHLVMPSRYATPPLLSFQPVRDNRP
jgi:hypothetical protein